MVESWQHAEGACRWRLKTLLADVLVLLRQSEAMKLLAEPLPPDADAAARYRYHLARGYATGKVEDLALAARIAEEVNNPRWEVDALVRKGNIEYRRNDATAAEATYERAVAVAERHSDEHAAAEAYTSQGFFFFRQERLGQAERALQRALALAEKINLPLVAMRCRGNLGLTYLRWGDHARALDLITRAEATAREHGQRVDQVRLLQNLGNIQYMLGQHAVARDYLVQALPLAREANDRASEATGLFNLSLAYMELGDLEAAAKAAETSYRLRRELKDPKAEPFHRFAQARILRAKGDYAAAAALLEKLASSAAPLPWFAWSVHAELAAVEERRKNGRAAAEHYEKAIGILHGARREISSASAQFSFISENIGLHQQYIRFLASRGKAEEALRVSDWSRAQGEAAVRKPGFTFEQLRRASRARNETLVAFSVGSHESYGWVIAPERAVMAVLPDASTIRAAVERWEREMDAPQRETAAAAALYAMLFEPLLGSGGVPAATAIAPDGILHRINPEALWTKGKYWIEAGGVVRVSTIASFLEQRPPRAAGGQMLIAGAPVASKEFPELPGAAKEIEAISRYFDATVLRGQGATVRAYREAGPEKYNYLHFATHSLPNAFDPMESTLVLSPGEGGGHLTAKEIAGRPIRARLVMLASCRSAGDKISAGGLLGLGFAFLQAGAESVVASLWDVDDRVASEFVREMYRGLAAGETPEASVRESKLKIYRGALSRTPKGWSSWVLLRGRVYDAP